MNKKGISYWLDLFKEKTAIVPSSNSNASNINEANLNKYSQSGQLDAKTGLLEEIAFKETEKKLISIAERNSLSPTFTEIFMDIDNFKLFNEDFGYVAGDDTLYKVGKAILSTISEQDIAGRIGGEKLAVITNQTSLTKSNSDKDINLAENIRRAIQDQQLSTGRPVTVSIGIAEYIKGEGIENFSRRLESAEKLAKKKGKNRVVVSLIVDNKEIYQDWTSKKNYKIIHDKKNNILEINEVLNG